VGSKKHVFIHFFLLQLRTINGRTDSRFGRLLISYTVFSKPYYEALWIDWDPIGDYAGVAYAKRNRSLGFERWHYNVVLCRPWNLESKKPNGYDLRGKIFLGTQISCSTDKFNIKTLCIALFPVWNLTSK